MTMLFAVFMARSRKAEFQIPFERPKMKTLLQSVGISVCGIPIALVLSALAALLSSAGADSSEDITKYPIWLAMIAFAIVLCIFFFKKNPVEFQVSGYKGRQLVTKEGYITMAVCLCVTGMLLMI